MLRPGGERLVAELDWPEADPTLLVAESMTIAVQVLGKLRATIQVPVGADEAAVVAAAEAEENVQRAIATGADTAEVVFLARYRIGGGSAVRMTEHSRFVREDGHWYYLDAR